MDENPTTETRAAAGKAMPATVREPGGPEEVSQLRQKLGRKATVRVLGIVTGGTDVELVGDSLPTTYKISMARFM